MSAGIQSGGIVLSCGCRYSEQMGEMEDLDVRYRSESCDPIDGIANAVAYAVYCPSCRGMLDREGLLIASDVEEREWLESTSSVPKAQSPAG